MKKFLTLLLVLLMSLSLCLAFVACGDGDDDTNDSSNDDNQGDDNQGDDNQGDDNQGDDNQGDDNQGDDNQGDDNQGDDNQGDDNQGDDNQGDDNQGDDNQGDAHQHAEVTIKTENLVPATCTTKGSYDEVAYCSCEAEVRRTAKVIDALGHTDGEAVVENNVAPDCENTGSYDNVVYCSVCDAELSRETVTVDALGHDTVAHEAKAPTCTEKGWDAYETCSKCDYTTYNEKAALGHTDGEAIVENNVAPDCENTGSYNNVVYCSVCDAELSRETITVDALGHAEGSVVVENNVDPDCENTGSYDNVVYCSVCDAELSRETITVDALGHTEVVDPAVESTCTTTGLTAGKHCSVCDTVLVEQLSIPQKGHTNGSVGVENYVAAGCKTSGSYDNVIYCTECDAEIMRIPVTLPELGHALSAAVIENKVDPTCTEKGSYDNVIYCSRCDCELIRTPVSVDAPGHDIDEFDALDPNCTESGWKAYVVCSRCDYSTYEEVPALGHTEGEAVVENSVAPDCENAGSYDSVVYCSVCDAELSRETITVDALGHTEASSVVENKVEPGCETAGSFDRVVYCTVCDDELSRTTIDLEELGHDIVVEHYVAATCSTAGHTAYKTCSRCDYETAYYELPATYHSYNLKNPYVCEHCGEDLPASEGLEFIEVDGGYSVLFIGDCFDDVIVIPYEYNGQPVVAIEAYAFSGMEFTSVIIPGSVKTIGDDAFSWNPILENVVMLDGVEEIGMFAFMGCDMLSSVTLANTVTYIGDSAFDSCYSLECIVIPASVEYVGYSAFGYCAGNLVIICEATDKPDYWDFDWNDDGSGGKYTVVWGYLGGDCEHRDIDDNGYCDLCGNIFSDGFDHLACYDKDNDKYCDYCYNSIGDAPCMHEDVDGDRLCDYCGEFVGTKVEMKPQWTSESIVMQLNLSDNNQELSSELVRYVQAAGSYAYNVDKEVRIRNIDAHNTTRVSVTYNYWDNIEANGWGQTIDHIEHMINSSTQKNAPDVYSTFIYDLVASSIKGYFANLITTARGSGNLKGLNYFEFVYDKMEYEWEYSLTGNDRGFMYEWMQSSSLSLYKMYVLASDYYIDTVRAMYVIPVNASLIEDYVEDITGDRNGDGEYTIDDFYLQIRANEWTFDVMMDYANAVYTDDGDPSTDAWIGDNKIGFAISDNTRTTNALLYSSLSTNSLDEEWSNEMNDYDFSYTRFTSELSDTLYKITELFSSSGVIRVKNGQSEFGYNHLAAIRNRFSNNAVLFGDIVMAGYLEFPEYQDMGDKLGVAPVPINRSSILNSDGEYIDGYNTQIDNIGRAGAIAKNTTKFVECTAFLNYQSTHSDKVLECYFGENLCYSSKGAARMLSFIRSNIHSNREFILETVQDAVCENNDKLKLSYIITNTNDFQLGWQSVYNAKNSNLNYLKQYFMIAGD